MFTSSALDGVFIAESDGVLASADGALNLEVDGDESAKFAVIVLSSTPVPAGTEFNDYMVSRR